MEFKFEIDKMDKDEIEIIPNFCKYLLSEIKSDIIENISYIQMNKRKDYLINTKIINWIEKPKDINMHKICLFIVNSFVCKHIKNNVYSISINPMIKLPMSKTKIDKVARFLDKGNEQVQPTQFISKILRVYMKNINKYWKLYASNELQRITVNECIKIV